MEAKTALITGITGQDGAYLAELLISKGYIVYGGYRRVSAFNPWRLKALNIYDSPSLELIPLDITDPANCCDVIKRYEPDEVYNLAAQSFVGTSFKQPIATANATALGALNMLEAIRIDNCGVKFFQASTSEMFGNAGYDRQEENNPIEPCSPYGNAKAFAHWATINYRESYDIFACSGIMFNHESPLRGDEFVTQKIARGVANIYHGKQECIELGNIDVSRDWGYAKEYVDGMWRMMQADKPDTYILATGKETTLSDFVRAAFECIDMDIELEGSGESALGIDTKSGRTVVRTNLDYYRPTDVRQLCGVPEKARVKLGWEAKTTVSELCKIMVDAALKRS